MAQVSSDADPTIPAGFVRADRRTTPVADRPLFRGCVGPRAALPPRRPGSVRRSTSLDMLRPDGLFGDLVLAGRGRDLRTGWDGAPSVVATGGCDIRIDFVTNREIVAAATSPSQDDPAPLVGVRAASGLRSVIANELPHERANETLVHQLLDDVPVATLISGGVFARNGFHLPHHEEPHRLPWVGTCAGWAEGAAMTRDAERTGVPSFVGEGPAVPRAWGSDVVALHDLGPLPPMSYRRLRLLDAAATSTDTTSVDVFFRDSYVEPDGTESVVHEYSMTLVLSGPDHLIGGVEVTPHVLPGPDCINARASALRVTGTPLAGLRARVGSELIGTSTCTHLNDMLRSLEGLRSLLEDNPR